MVGGIGFVTAIYAFTSLVILGVAPTAGLDHETASAEVFNIIGNPTIASIVYVGAFLGIFSATYTCFVPQI